MPRALTGTVSTLAVCDLQRYAGPAPRQKASPVSEPDRPQLYLVTPPAFDPDAFAGRLAAVLDAVPVACLRLAMASHDADSVARAADRLRPLAHDRDIPIVIARHRQLVQPLGLDGVHLEDGQRRVRETRKALGADAIIGAFCGTSRHDGLGAAEAGADYVAFGPAGATPLGDGTVAAHELFAWWSEIIEIPVVAEGALTVELVETLAPVTDFLAVGEEIWNAENPVSALRALLAPLG